MAATLTSEREAPASKKLPLYYVVVHNCDCHTFDDVIFGLMRVLGTKLQDAVRKAVEIDHTGRGVVALTHLEAAEMYAARLRDEVISHSGTKLRTSVVPAE